MSPSPFSHRRRTLLSALPAAWILMALGTACRPAQEPVTLPSSDAVPEPLAVVTELTGPAYLRRGSPPRHPLQSLDVLLAGSVLETAADSRAQAVCSNDRLIRLRGRTRLTPNLCDDGVVLPSGTFERLRPWAGRLQPIPGLDRLPTDQREDLSDYGQVPVPLSPRSTALLRRRPTMVFSAVPQADLYTLSWLGEGDRSLAVQASELDCRPAPFSDTTQCEQGWPPLWPPLEAGHRYWLEIKARHTLDTQPTRSREVNTVDVLPEPQRRRLQQTLHDLQHAPHLGDTTHALARAGVLVHYGVFADAIDDYRTASNSTPSALLWTTLGDLYRKIHLYRPALGAYRRAETLATLADERAAAHEGMGHVAYAWGLFSQARRHFNTAGDEYGLAGRSPRAQHLHGLSRQAQQRGEVFDPEPLEDLGEPTDGSEATSPKGDRRL